MQGSAVSYLHHVQPANSQPGIPCFSLRHTQNGQPLTNLASRSRHVTFPILATMRRLLDHYSTRPPTPLIGQMSQAELITALEAKDKQIANEIKKAKAEAKKAAETAAEALEEAKAKALAKAILSPAEIKAQQQAAMRTAQQAEEQSDLELAMDLMGVRMCAVLRASTCLNSAMNSRTQAGRQAGTHGAGSRN